MSPRSAPWRQTAPPSPTSFRVGTALGPYRLERHLGSGSFGEVWEAADHGIPSAPRRVALKILSVIGVPGGVEALSREAEICRELNHPNIIEILGVHRTDEAAFVVMEFVPGPTLESAARLLAGHALRMPRSALLDTGLGVARALGHAWDGLDRQGRPHHIAHRNLRPAEVMLTEGGVVKVGGFSLAKVAEDPTQTAAGVLRGSPTYMPPERWRGQREITAAGDLFSLGVLLWELAAGGRFFPRLGLGAMYDLIERRSPDEEASVVAAVFPELAPVLRDLLQRDPGRRTKSAQELVAQLAELRSRIDGEGSLEQFVWMLGTLHDGEPERPAPDWDSMQAAWDRLVESAEESLRGDELIDEMPTSPGMAAVAVPPADGGASSLSGPFWDDRDWMKGDWQEWAPQKWTQSVPQLAPIAAEAEDPAPRKRAVSTASAPIPRGAAEDGASVPAVPRAPRRGVPGAAMHAVPGEASRPARRRKRTTPGADAPRARALEPASAKSSARMPRWVVILGLIVVAGGVAAWLLTLG